jgi:hypothetical protein
MAARFPHDERNQDATIYIGGIDEKTTDSLIWELMLQVGPVVSVHLPKDRVSQTHQGYGILRGPNRGGCRLRRQDHELNQTVPKRRYAIAEGEGKTRPNSFQVVAHSEMSLCNFIARGRMSFPIPPREA